MHRQSHTNQKLGVVRDEFGRHYSAIEPLSKAEKLAKASSRPLQHTRLYVFVIKNPSQFRIGDSGPEAWQDYEPTLLGPYLRGKLDHLN